MKIALICSNYFPFVGGVETHARQIAHEMTRRGHSVKVVAGNFAPSKLSPRWKMLHEDLLAPPYSDFMDEGVPVTALTPSRLDRARLLPIAVRALPKVQRVAYHSLRRFGYRSYQPVYGPRLKTLLAGVDVVHSLAGNYLGWASEEAARFHQTPFVVTPFVHPHQWGDGPDDVRYYGKASAVIGLVSTDSAYLEQIGVPVQKIRTIGVSPDLPPQNDGAAFRAKHDISPTAPLVVYVGRMMPQKGAKAVLASAPLVWETHPETRFVFIGPASPSEAEAFNGIDKRITYLGKVSGQEKADALAACDVFCMPSLSEILPTVYLEAWSLKKPVVGGMAHGLPELVEQSGGGLAAEQDGEAVSGALLRILGDKALQKRMGETGYDLVAARYSVSAVTTALENLYRNLIAEGKNGDGAEASKGMAHG